MSSQDRIPQSLNLIEMEGTYELCLIYPNNPNMKTSIGLILGDYKQAVRVAENTAAALGAKFINEVA